MCAISQAERTQCGVCFRRIQGQRNGGSLRVIGEGRRAHLRYLWIWLELDIRIRIATDSISERPMLLPMSNDSTTLESISENVSSLAGSKADPWAVSRLSQVSRLYLRA